MPDKRFRNNPDLDLAETALADILDAIGDAVILLDEDQRILFFNRGAEQIFGYRAEGVLGQPHDVLLPDRFVESHRQNMKAFMEDRAGTLKMDGQGEPLGRRKDGAEFPVEVSASKLFQNGKLFFVVILRDISRRKRREYTLQQQAQIIDQIHDSVVSTDLNAYVTSWNEGAERMFGFSPEEAIGKHIAFVYPEEQLDFLQQEVIAPLKEKGNHQIEVLMRKKDGEDFEAHLSLSLLRDVSGEAIGMIGYTMDISALKRTERELRARARRQAVEAELGQLALAGGDLQALMDKIVATVAETLEVEYCKVLELLPGREALLLKSGVGWKEGYVGEALVGAKTNSQAGYTLLVEDPVIVEDLGKETRFSNPPLLSDHNVASGMSVVIPGSEGPYGILGAHTARQREFSQDDANFLAAMANILAVAIERKRAEEHLAYQADLLANVHDAILATDEKMILTSWNKAAEELYGWRAEEVLGKKVQGVIRSDFSEDQRKQALKALAKNRGYRLEVRQYCRDGQPIWVEGTSMTLRDEERHITGYVSVNRDITERKRAAEALRESERRLRELGRQVVTAQEQERRRVSRELHDEAGQELMALKISLELLGKDLPEEAESLHQRIEGAVRLAEETMERIRLLAHDLRPPELEAVGLDPVLEDYCQEFGRRTRLAIRYQGTRLPALPDEVSICLYRVLQEALTNVLKHAQARKVRVGLGYDGEVITLSVMDDGQGFETSDAAGAAHPKGIGILGMRERLELLGGDLEIRSRPGEGVHLKAWVPGVE
jgi:PAS domain S-box-containing protein